MWRLDGASRVTQSDTLGDSDCLLVYCGASAPPRRRRRPAPSAGVGGVPIPGSPNEQRVRGRLGASPAAGRIPGERVCVDGGEDRRMVCCSTGQLHVDGQQLRATQCRELSTRPGVDPGANIIAKTVSANCSWPARGGLVGLQSHLREGQYAPSPTPSCGAHDAIRPWIVLSLRARSTGTTSTSLELVCLSFEVVFTAGSNYTLERRGSILAGQTYRCVASPQWVRRGSCPG